MEFILFSEYYYIDRIKDAQRREIHTKILIFKTLRELIT
jgi:hypothetical protein